MRSDISLLKIKSPCCNKNLISVKLEYIVQVSLILFTNLLVCFGLFQ